jgi:hypothetical protein
MNISAQAFHQYSHTSRHNAVPPDPQGGHVKLTKKLILTGALVLPMGLASLTMSAPAFGKAKIPECSAKLNLKTFLVTFSKCKDTANTGKGGSMNASAIVAGGSATISWTSAPPSSTTILWNAPVELAPGAPGNTCPKGDTEYKGSGVVTGGTAPAINSIPIGDTVTMNVCLKGTKVTVLKPGILFS